MNRPHRGTALKANNTLYQTQDEWGYKRMEVCSFKIQKRMPLEEMVRAGEEEAVTG